MRAVGIGSNIGYDLYGNGHHALLLLPALGADARVWEHQVNFFTPEYTVIACETGGHEPIFLVEKRPSLREYAAAAIEVLDAVGVSRANVMGVSMGGMVAQELALAYSDRVDRLVLVSTTSQYPRDSRVALLERAQTACSEGMEPIADAAVRRWFTAQYASAQAETVADIRQMLLSADPKSYAEAARAVAAVDTAARLGEISAPTLVVVGGQDESMPPGAGEALANGIRGARMVRLPQAAHLCNFEAAEDFNRETRSFLATPSDGSADDLQPLSPW